MNRGLRNDWVKIKKPIVTLGRRERVEYQFHEAGGIYSSGAGPIYLRERGKGIREYFAPEEEHTLHDLRRTCRTHMSELGVDRHSYLEQKRNALEL